MFQPPSKFPFPRLTGKVFLLAAGSTLITALSLVALALWQSGLYSRLAQQEMTSLVRADLEHITQGAMNLVATEHSITQDFLNKQLKVLSHTLDSSGGLSLMESLFIWTAINQYSGEKQRITLPKMSHRGKWLGAHRNFADPSPIVDEMTRLVGGTATVFQRMNQDGDLLRVATTVPDGQGNRAIGTFIPAVHPDGTADPVVSTLKRGRTYLGRAFVVDQYYLTAYEPLFDAAGNWMGAIYVGIPQKTLEQHLRGPLLKTRVGKTGYVFILGASGKQQGCYILSRGGRRDGECLWDVTSENGRFPAREVVKRALNLAPGEFGELRYPWQNPGEGPARERLALFKYYAPSDWIVGVSVKTDEFEGYLQVLRGGRDRLGLFLMAAGLILTLCVGCLAILLARALVRPVTAMQSAVETINRGDLNARVEVTTRDEIGDLATAFNRMNERLNQTMTELSLGRERYRGLFQNAVEGVFISTIEGGYLRANPSMARILGYNSPEDLLYRVQKIKQQLYVNPEERDRILTELREGNSVRGREVQLYRKDGSALWVSLSLYLNEQEECIEGFLTDISEKKALAEELEKQAETDQLTGAYNMRKFNQLIQQEIERCRREKSPLSVGLFDIDRFKEINDNFGHQTGDQVLKGVALIVFESIRKIDYFIRWGGDEFLILCPGITADQMLSLAERLRQKFQSHAFDRSLHVTTSFGVTEFKEPESFEDLLYRADQALYQAKARGRNCAVLLPPNPPAE